MAQRSSGYDLTAGNTYVTPPWVYSRLYAVENFENPWDCAPVDATFDFLSVPAVSQDIVTNPPYGRNGGIAMSFIRHALNLTRERRGKVAMLLSNGFDAGKTRQDVFREGPFKAKYVLLQRIRWENLEQKDAGPSQNHAWYVWDWAFGGTPEIHWI